MNSKDSLMHQQHGPQMVGNQRDLHKMPHGLKITPTTFFKIYEQQN